MKDILIFSVLVVTIITPLAILFFWLLFKRSIAFPNAVMLAWHGTFTAVLSHFVVSFGLVHLFWAVPLAILNIIFSLIIFNKLASKPIKSLTEDINELAKGNFENDFDNSLLKKKNEIGTIANALTQMSQNLRRSSTISDLVSKGKLHSAQNLSSEIEHKGSLDNAIDRMIIKLRNIITQISESSVIIASGALEISKSSQSVASGANQQAVSLEELSASMEEMLVSIKQNSDNASQARKIAEKNTKDIKELNISVAKAVDSMRLIAEKIIIMQEIAKKTDILAINASIEASRAGNLGKGFASVAQEVRRLAENAKDAAVYITDMANNTFENATQSSNLLNEVIPDILFTSDVVQEIAFASQEQNEAADQINAAISQLNQVTQQNAASAEELAGSSEEFTQQADQMKETMAFFNMTIGEIT